MREAQSSGLSKLTEVCDAVWELSLPHRGETLRFGSPHRGSRVCDTSNSFLLCSYFIFKFAFIFIFVGVVGNPLSLHPSGARSPRPLPGTIFAKLGFVTAIPIQAKLHEKDLYN